MTTMTYICYILIFCKYNRYIKIHYINKLYYTFNRFICIHCLQVKMLTTYFMYSGLDGVLGIDGLPGDPGLRGPPGQPGLFYKLKNYIISSVN